jgi:hypothetical protein
MDSGFALRAPRDDGHMKARTLDSRDLSKQINLICPTGKSVTAPVFALSSPDRKNISVFPKSDPLYIPRVSFPLEGRSRDRHGRRERDVVDAAASGAQIWSQGGFRLVSDQWRTDELSCRGRQSRVVLTPRRRRQVCGGFASPTGRTKP